VGFYAPQQSLNWLDGLGGKKANNAVWSLLVMDDNNMHGSGTLDCFKLTVTATNPKK
jgi:hypothetical protein